MKTLYGFIAGIDFCGMVVAASRGDAWIALIAAGITAWCVLLSVKVDQ